MVMDVLKAVLFFGITMSFFNVATSYGAEWKEEKGKHFIIRYESAVGESWAKQVLRRSESYYTKLAQQIGYVRYQEYWTWENRVPITIYENQERFSTETGQPSWVQGGAMIGRDGTWAKKRAIVTFKRETEFLDETLPHEISHLILKDFIGFETRVPRWFDEGVAQLQQQHRPTEMRSFLRGIVQRTQQVPFHALYGYNVAYETDPVKVSIFYAQSLSMIEFLIKNYGTQRFGVFCKNLRDGKSFNSAFLGAYQHLISSRDEFEKKWLSYMKN